MIKDRFISYFFYFIAFLVVLFYLFLFQNKNGDIFIGNHHAWGDWPVHFTWASYFVHNSFPPKMHPLLFGHEPVYPWLTDAISALFIKLGVPFFLSFTLPNAVFTILLIYFLYQTYKYFFKSSKDMLLAIFLLLTNGGVGFYYFLQTIRHDFSFIFKPPHNYTQLSHLHLEFINFVSGLLIPQRSFLLGSLIGIVLLCMVLAVLIQNKKFNIYQCFAFVLLFLVLPIAHTHAYMATFGISLIWSIYLIFKSKKITKETATLVLSLFLSLALFFLLYNSVEKENYFKFVGGWYASFHGENIFVFWFKNWTVVPFVAFVTFFQLEDKRKIVYLPFLILFLVANFVQFQPYLFDNTKFFFFSAIGISALAVEFFRRIKNKFLVMMIIFLISFSGLIEIYKVALDLLHPKLLFSAQDMESANWIKENVPIDALIVIENRHNHFVPTLTGRQVLMGYTGWLDNYGFDYSNQKTIKSNNQLMPGEQYRVISP